MVNFIVYSCYNQYAMNTSRRAELYLKNDFLVDYAKADLKEKVAS
jgi:hypothetical protein